MKEYFRFFLRHVKHLRGELDDVWLVDIPSFKSELVENAFSTRENIMDKLKLLLVANIRQWEVLIIDSLFDDEPI